MWTHWVIQHNFDRFDIICIHSAERRQEIITILTVIEKSMLITIQHHYCSFLIECDACVLPKDFILNLDTVLETKLHSFL